MSRWKGSKKKKIVKIISSEYAFSLKLNYILFKLSDTMNVITYCFSICILLHKMQIAFSASKRKSTRIKKKKIIVNIKVRIVVFNCESSALCSISLLFFLYLILQRPIFCCVYESEKRYEVEWKTISNGKASFQHSWMVFYSIAYLPHWR